MDCKKNANATTCSCTYEPCPRKGLCCDCVSYHRASGEVPGCFFDEKAERTYDRSMLHLIRSQVRKQE
jgi:hypothetical protein